MTDVDFAGAVIPVRDEIRAAHREVWDRLARAGSGYTGEQRVAMIAAVRGAADCALCAERAGAASPLAVPGRHDHAGVLPDTAVEVVHQVVRDPGRLSRAWFEKSLADGLGEAEYVEILGVVVAVVSIDSLCRGVGAPLHPLPEPVAGEPSRRVPTSARVGVGFVRMIPSGAATGAEADLYPGPRPPNVQRALSLVPDGVRMLRTLSAVHYLPIERVADPRARRTLDRMQMELVAGRVSALNECFY